MPDPPTGASRGSPANVLGPSIVGLFIQGLETGMVFSQLATWLSLPEHTEHRSVTVLTVFITTVGFVQTALCFVSSWQTHTKHRGEPVLDTVPTLIDNFHIILTVLISTPVQLLLIWRCSHILRRNAHFIIPLLLLLLCTVALAIFDNIGLLLPMSAAAQSSRSPLFWCLLLYGTLSSILDVTISSVLFYYLTQSRKRVYADHAVQWISRRVIIVWQSAIPPTVCAIGISITYGVSRHLDHRPAVMWYPTLQAMVGKLYVLSHFYNINARPLFSDEQDRPSTHMRTLTVPALTGTSHSILNASEEHPS
ncbi:hypothetical protein EI94DRAFT_210773 [Lactarius quietus]|nr:hypothetical protein EI94DRAFT_210773 [Lactarius quietus]